MSEILEWCNRRIVWVDSSNIEDSISKRQNGIVDGFGISPWLGYASRTLEFLDGLDVGGLVLPAADHHDLSGIGRARNVRFLSLSMFKVPFDFGPFTDLVDLSIDWHSEVTLPPASCHLEHLALSGYRPGSRNLTELPHYQSLQYLGIVQGNLESLAGVENLTRLASARLCYLPKLKQIASISATPVETIDLKSCKAITDFPSLANCAKLKVLRLADCGRLPTLRFLDAIHSLEETRFVGTQIEDGDMTPLLRLKAAGFFKNHRYSHTPEQVEAANQRNQPVRQAGE